MARIFSQKNRLTNDARRIILLHMKHHLAVRKAVDTNNAIVLDAAGNAKMLAHDAMAAAKTALVNALEPACWCRTCRGEGFVYTYPNGVWEAYEVNRCGCGGLGPQHPAFRGTTGMERSVEDLLALQQGPRLLLDALDAAWRAVEAATQAEASAQSAVQASPQRGDLVIVVKGRKLTPGTFGVLVAQSSGQWGERVGLRVASRSDLVWVSAENVAKWNGPTEGDEEIADLLIAVEGAKDAARAANDAALERARASGLPALKGTPKQVAWAEQIRAKRLEQEEWHTLCRSETSAKWWIEHR